MGERGTERRGGDQSQDQPDASVCEAPADLTGGIPTKFTTAGPIPEVMLDFRAPPKTASDLAYGSHVPVPTAADKQSNEVERLG
jgi:hypothetical protein